ncbi:MAG TPA: DinB family protein [Flavobacteriales bacterium]|nr:DinB family protein [Flavobacteriales bacterium]
MKDGITTDALPPYLLNYFTKARGRTVQDALEASLQRTASLYRSIPEERGTYRYADGKWSIKEVLQHITDAERIFAYRALRFARNDSTVLAPYEENEYAPASEADRLALSILLDDHRATRGSTITLFNSFSPAMLVRRGAAGANVVSVEQLGFIIAGHAEHHCDILQQRYL